MQCILLISVSVNFLSILSGTKGLTCTCCNQQHHMQACAAGEGNAGSQYAQLVGMHVVQLACACLVARHVPLFQPCHNTTCTCSSSSTGLHSERSWSMTEIQTGLGRYAYHGQHACLSCSRLGDASCVQEKLMNQQ